MFNTNYIIYLVISNCYKNLEESIKILNKISENITNVINKYNENSGDYITSTVTDFKSLQSEVDGFITKIKNVKRELFSNGQKFNKILDDWKAKVGQVISEKIIDDKIVGFADSIATCEYKVSQSYIKSVGIANDDGYILVNIETATNTYRKSIAAGISHNKRLIASTKKINSQKYNFSGVKIK